MSDVQEPESDKIDRSLQDNIDNTLHEPAYRIMGLAGGALFSFLLLGFTIVLSYTLFCFWSAAYTDTPTQPIVIYYLGNEITSLTYESLLLIIVCLCGALGSMVHVLRSVSWYIGNRELRRSWLIKYILQPFIGGTLALVFYFVIRAGLLPTESSALNVNILGLAGIASLVGLFSDQAVLKLKVIAETVLTRPRAGSDAMPQNDHSNDHVHDQVNGQTKNKNGSSTPK